MICLIYEKFPEDILLGLNFLKPAKAKLDFETGTCSFKKLNKKVNIDVTEDFLDVDTPTYLSIHESIILPAMEGVVMEAFADKHSPYSRGQTWGEINTLQSIGGRQGVFTAKCNNTLRS